MHVYTVYICSYMHVSLQQVLVQLLRLQLNIPAAMISRNLLLLLSFAPPLALAVGLGLFCLQVCVGSFYL